MGRKTIFDKQKQQPTTTTMMMKKKKTLCHIENFDYHIVACRWLREWKMSVCVRFFLIGMFNAVIVLLISLLLSHLIDSTERTHKKFLYKHRCGIFAPNILFFFRFLFTLSFILVTCISYFFSAEEQQSHTL